MLYVLERFLYRVSISSHRQRLILKGGMLLAAFVFRRPTRDVDLLAEAVANDIETASALIRDIVAIEVDDGVAYDASLLKSEPIREQNLYAAVRIVVPARIGPARHPLRVDLNVGDPVTPSPTEFEYPALLDAPFPILGYPIETVLAEKVVTMVARGDANTRDRDFADVLLLIGDREIDAAHLAAAIDATAAHRDVALRPLARVLVELGSRRQPAWSRFIARAGLLEVVPTRFEEAIRQIREFADPILTQTRARTGNRWDPRTKQWNPASRSPLRRTPPQ